MTAPAPAPGDPSRRNLVPRRYRSVSVARVDVPLTPEALRDHFLGREAYRRTGFIVARSGERAALIEVRKASEEPLFSPIVDMAVLAGPEDCVLVHDSGTDTAIPTHLASAARRHAPGARCVVIHGRYEHVSFIVKPDPIPLRVVEVEPPRPAKLIDQVRRLLDVAEDLPPVDLRPDVVDLADLASTRPSHRYLFPCRGSGVQVAGAGVVYLDERPPPGDWVLVGCARSREIHRWFYRSESPYVEMCPRERSGTAEIPTLTKCCRVEFGVEQEGRLTIVPWGATLDEIRGALQQVLRAAEPAWAPV